MPGEGRMMVVSLPKVQLTGLQVVEKMGRAGEMTGGHLGTTGIGGMTGEGMIGTGKMIEEVMTEIGEMTADMIVKEEMIEDMIRTEEITKVLIVVAEEMTGGMRVEEEETTALPMNLLVT